MGSITDDEQRQPMSPPMPPRTSTRKQPPQKGVDDLWGAFNTKYPGLVLSILPKDAWAKSKASREPKGTVHSQKASRSYEEAAAKCSATVKQISKECRRVNIRYRDPHFDIEFDLKRGLRNCLDGINRYPDAGDPKAVKRVHVSLSSPASPAWQLNGNLANIRGPAILYRRGYIHRCQAGESRRLLVPSSAWSAWKQGEPDTESLC